MCFYFKLQRIHDQQRERIVQRRPRQRVQHLLGPLHLVHLPTEGGGKEQQVAQPLRPGKQICDFKIKYVTFETFVCKCKAVFIEK